LQEISRNKESFRLWLSINKHTALAAPRTDAELAAETQMFDTAQGPAAAHTKQPKFELMRNRARPFNTGKYNLLLSY
jgi:hypothetical protein